MANEVAATQGAHRFVAALPEGRALEWLKLSLGEMGTVVPAETGNLEEIRGVLDLTDTPLLFVWMDRHNLAQSAALVEGILDVKSLITVIAVGEGVHQDELLAAMRAGARDFLTVGTRASEVRALIRRALDKAPVQPSDAADKGRVWAVMNARPSMANAFFCTHLAQAIQRDSRDAQVLLLDLAIPPADSLALLNLKSSFSFFDAVRNLKRLDRTLLVNALPTHATGLQVLSMPDSFEDEEEEVSTAELYLLLGSLKRYYSHLVVNLGGLPAGGFLNVMLSGADEVLQVVDQSIPSCQQNLRRIRQVEDSGVRIESRHIVVDRYQHRQAPKAEMVADRMGAPLAAVLRTGDGQRLRAINLGKTLLELAPSDPYAREVQSLARQLLQGDEVRARKGGLARLKRLLGGR
ncbi:AAA family ATPase [Alkalilimnicola ehrlichii MLHE-1]|uniref:Pilus assembly protein CpaE n=1 Tax=Alkalilimnicola ehrlichii (strain ATCC BAA-1101 / DSM 17681 / MLHE-1) TaxID=187272 RepID=Q0A6N4_ALKEH|nr:pilus assembly protein CpaE [Alkalilimnicola ehrlichii]ABI57503.1 pilus assembly protein CpaE [Alkalilimnicola ehrlichii MLHE-1]